MSYDCDRPRSSLSRTILLATLMSAQRQSRREGPGLLWMVLFWLVVILVGWMKWGG